MNAASHQLEANLHEQVRMDVAELPARFFRHVSETTGPYCQQHWHEQLELSYVVSGEFTVITGGNHIRLQPGDVLLVNANELHEYHIDQAPIDIFCMLLDVTQLQGRFVSQFDSRYLVPLTTSEMLLQNHVRGDAVMESFFTTLLEEVDKREDGFEFAIKSAVYGIIARLVRNYIDKSPADLRGDRKTHNAININKAISYVEAHYNEPISLETLANHLGFTKYYFCRLFKSITGKSPIEYINEYRVHQAKNLLLETDNSITEIALAVGYNDSNYFSRIFKAFVFQTPSEFKRRNLKGSMLQFRTES